MSNGFHVARKKSVFWRFSVCVFFVVFSYKLKRFRNCPRCGALLVCRPFPNTMMFVAGVVVLLLLLATIMSDLLESPKGVRLQCRRGLFKSQTSGLSPGYAQANLCILPKEIAFDFLLFCQRNPKPCPLLEVLEDGRSNFGDDIDIRTDLPMYRIYENGE